MNSLWIIIFLVSIIFFLGIYFFTIFRHRDGVNLLSLLSWVIIGIAFFIIIHIVGLMIFPIKIQETDEPIKIMNQNHQVKRGEFLILKIHIKKYEPYPSMIYPSIICDDGSYLVLPWRYSNVPVGEYDFIVSDVYRIPLETPLGICKTRSTDVFRINLLREKTFVHESESFEIIN